MENKNLILKIIREICMKLKKLPKKLLETNGIKVCWRSWGKGTPLVLLHGGYGSWRHWIKQAIPFSKNYNVLIPDMPGFGESDDLPLPHTPEKIASNLADTLIKLISLNENPLVCGFSFGGLIAGHLSYELINRQLSPRKLILVGPGGLGAKRGEMKTMIARHSKMTEQEVYDAHRTNLEILMFYNPKKLMILQSIFKNKIQMITELKADQFQQLTL